MFDSSSIIRVFFGIPIPDDLAHQFQKRILKINPHLKHQVRWTRPGNHHITLRFLGNIAQQKIPKFLDPIRDATQEITPFEVILSHITPFPTRHHGNLATANIRPSRELQTLYDAIDLVVTSENFPPDNRPYLPHITIFRLSGNQQSIDFKEIPLGNQRLLIKEFILYQSIPIEKGSLYVPLHKFPLKINA